MRRTKIVCTIGPTSESPEVLRKLIESGMNVARLNFSHGNHDEHVKKIHTIRELSREMGMPVAILQDLCGPKMRTGKIEAPGIELVPGAELILTAEEIVGRDNRVSVSYKGLPDEVKAGDIILLADGLMELIVTKVTGREIACIVVVGGLLTSNKGINLPTSVLKIPALTAKDREDLAFGLAHDVDFVALSFVKTVADIREVKELIAAAGKTTPVIAKIEKHEAISNIDGIMEVTDGIMVARGDLGVEIPLEDVPGVQKMLVAKSVAAGKPVIIATQMLRSMVDSPRPTRAEATDVANAVLDGADAVMLSEETANGTFPVETVQYMSRIAAKAEESYPHKQFMKSYCKERISDSVAYAACILADKLDTAAIVAPTKSGFTARQISRFRPHAPIVALSPDESAMRRLCLFWGCYPSLVTDPGGTDEMIDQGAAAALESGFAATGDTIVITAGHPTWVPGTTNMVKVRVA